ncbi:hypothetical protein ABEK56_26100, partial [Klebsiella pneumoniae]
MHKYKFSLPRLDITGMWVFSLGVWFHIVARLVYSKPWMAFFLAELIGHCCKVSDEAAFCLIQRPYISKTLLT